MVQPPEGGWSNELRPEDCVHTLIAVHTDEDAVGLAADLQLASAFAGTDLIEYLTGSPFIDEITAGGWHLDEDGMLAIPVKPGLGLTLERDAVKKYTGGERLLDA